MGKIKINNKGVTMGKYITEFYSAVCKKLKHKSKLQLVKPLTIHCNSCIKKENK